VLSGECGWGGLCLTQCYCVTLNGSITSSLLYASFWSFILRSSVYDHETVSSFPRWVSRVFTMVSDAFTRSPRDRV